MYRAVEGAVVLRAAVTPLAEPEPAWPDLEGNTAKDVTRWRAWAAEVWNNPSVANAITFAAPSLATALREVVEGTQQRPRQVRRAVESLARYLLRRRYRATPLGLFAGPAPIRVGNRTSVRWGTEHRAFARASDEWLNDVITALESDPEVMKRLLVVADPTCVVRGSTVLVRCRPGVDGPADTVLRRTPAVETVLTLAERPVPVGDIVAKLRADYPHTPAPTIEHMVRSLITHRVLLTSLHAPMTCDDALGHLLGQLESTGAADTPSCAALTERLHRVHRLLTRHDRAPHTHQPAWRSRAIEQMTEIRQGASRYLTVNLRPDVDVVLPQAVMREAERALDVISRISPYPHGTPAWQNYRTRFLERYSMGAVVPLLDLTDPDTGLGFPAGYRGTVLAEPARSTTRRDEHLLALAQEAALQGQTEITLTPRDLQALSLAEPSQVPPHIGLTFTVQARSTADLDDGRFTLRLVGLSQAAGTTTGRFLHTLPGPDRDRMTAAHAAMPTLTSGAVRAQTSCPPLRLPTRNVARVPAVHPHVISVSEHQTDATLSLDDLGVVADSRRLYLVSLSTGHIIEPLPMNAVEPTNATHPLVRFLYEAPRSHTAALTPFFWGAAAKLPFLPSVRVGRTILSAARWRLHAHDIADTAASLNDWLTRHHVPKIVYLGNTDQLLRLDLTAPAHRQLLFSELRRHQAVVLQQAPKKTT